MKENIKMKILFNCLSMEKGGAERVISVLSNKFIESNQVTLVTLIKSKPKYKLDKRIKLLQIDEDEYLKASKIKKKLIKLSYRRLTKLLKVVIKERPDIIISFLPEPSMRIMLLKKLSKKIYKGKFSHAICEDTSNFPQMQLGLRCRFPIVLCPFFCYD